MTTGLNTNSIRFKDATTLTIATGEVTATGGYHIIASESGTADDLATITLGYADVTVNGTSYRPMLIIKADTGDTITVKNGTGNIELSGGADYDLSGDKALLLFWNGSAWVNTDGSAGGGGGGGDLDQLATVYVSKAGNDANGGLNGNEPKLTIGSAITTASGLISGGANGVLISVMDGENYTENLTIPDAVQIVAEGATLIGTIEMGNNASITLNRQFSNGNNQNLVNKSGGAGHGFYKANRLDMRGTGGANTGGTALRNVSNGSILFAQVGVLFVNQDGEGVADATAGFGHIHFWTPDLYLAGNNAVGVSAGNNSNFIGYIDHLLEIGTPTNTTGILVDNAGAIVKTTVTELIADTAYNVVSGALHIVTSRLVGTRTGTPASEVSNVALIGGWGTFISTGSTLLSSLSMNTVNKITSMADPTNPQDAVTKNYADTTFQDDISGLALTGATVATDDKVLIQDTSDSDNLKTVTAQSIADLASGVSVAELDYSEATNTAGTIYTTGAWRTMTLNNEAYDVDGIVTLAANVFTLVAGTYQIIASTRIGTTASTGGWIRLQNTSSNTTVARSGYTSVSNERNVIVVHGFVTIGASANFELQIVVANNNGTPAINLESQTEKITTISIMKVG